MEFAEINLKVSSTVTDRIKDLITNNSHEIRQMRTDMIRVKATERVLFTTNTAGSVIIEKGDRRFMAVAVSRRRVGDTEYWKRFWAYLQDDSFIKNIADYLLSFKEEVERFSFRDERPVTTYYQALQCMSLSPELDFLKDLFFYHTEDVEEYKKDGVYFIPSTPFLTLYNEWREKHSMREKINVKTFGMKLKSLDGEYGITHEEKRTSNGFTIDAVTLREALANDFDIRPDDPRCLIDLNK
jgi:hypothetical protein